MADITIENFSNGAIEVDGSGVYSWGGTGVFDKVMQAINGNIQVQYQNGRITGTDYATVYLGMAQAAVTAAMNYVLTEQEAATKIDIMDMQKDDLEKQRDIKQYQLDVLLVDEHAKNTAQIDLMAAQKTHQNEETKYTNARKRIALASRIDNLLLEDLKAQSQQLATVGAGGLVPSTNDFAASNSLRQAVYDRAINGITLNNMMVSGESLEELLGNIEFTAGTAYSKA